MSFNTILVPIEQHDLMNATLETALVLARKFNSYIEGFALRPVVAPVMAMDIGGAFPLAELQENDTKMATEAKALFDAFMHKQRRRARRPQGRRRLRLVRRRAGRRPVRRQLRPGVRRHRAGPARRERAEPRLSTYEACLFESGRPILLAPPEAACRPWARTS